LMVLGVFLWAGCIKKITPIPSVQPEEKQGVCGVFTYTSSIDPCDLLKWPDIGMEERGMAILNTVKNPNNTDPEYVMLILDIMGSLLCYIYEQDGGYIIYESYYKENGLPGYRQFYPPEETKAIFDEVITIFKKTIKVYKDSYIQKEKESRRMYGGKK